MGEGKKGQLSGDGARLILICHVQDKVDESDMNACHAHVLLTRIAKLKLRRRLIVPWIVQSAATLEPRIMKPLPVKKREQVPE